MTPPDQNPPAVRILPGTRLRVAMVLAIAADIAQMIYFPLFFEGLASPAEDAVDLCVCAALTSLLGWHWEFLPSAFGKLVPVLDMAPLWTLAVASVYRKSKRLVESVEQGVNQAR